MIFNMNPAAVDASALTEAGIAIETGAHTAAATPILIANLPASLDTDMLAFVTALNASGATYAAMSAEHAAQRGVYAGAQALASAATQANEAITAAANSLA